MSYNKPFVLKDVLPIQRRDLVEYMETAIKRWINGDPVPYIWGGQNYLDMNPQKQKIEGLDCSGFCILGLVYAGIIGLDTFDATADWMWRNKKFPLTTLSKAMPGDLIYFGNPKKKISHVGMLYQRAADTWVMVEAAGGGQACTTKAAALDRNAYVRPTYITRRRDFVAIGKVI